MYSSKVHLLCFSLTSYLRLACVLLPYPFLVPSLSLATPLLPPCYDLPTTQKKSPANIRSQGISCTQTRARTGMGCPTGV